MVFAASSLVDALKETAAQYAKEASDKIVFNFAASSLLSRQIQAGAPADIFFSADEVQMDALEQEGLVQTGSRKDILSNSLVIVAPAEAANKIRSAAGLTNASVRRIALADPRAVPAGVYAKAYLEKNRLWTAVAPKVVPTENVRAALAAVESGNVDAGIVFKTDAAISKIVKVVWEVPRDEGPSIHYPAAVLKESAQKDRARAFLEFLQSETAGKIFARYGFVVMN